MKAIMLVKNIIAIAFMVSHLQVGAASEVAPVDVGEPAVMLEPVVVTRSRDAVSLPYLRAYDAVRKVADNTDGLVQLSFRLTPAKDTVTVSDLRLWIEYADQVVPIAISQDGFFSVPLLPEAVVKEAYFSANKRKGDLRVSVHLRPIADLGSMSLETARRSVQAAQRARADLIPWYFRLFTTGVNALGACRADIEFSILLGQPPVSLRADRTERDESGRLVHCVRIDRLEQLTSDASITIPADAHLLFLSN